MIAAVVFALPGSISASAVSQAEINKLKEQQAALDQQKKEVAAKIESKEYEQMSLLAKKAVLDEQVQLTEQEIQNITDQIAEYEVLIYEKGLEVEEAIKREEEQLELYKKRLRAMEENGSISYVAVIFGSNSFSDLLTRIDTISEIIASDELVYANLEEARMETEQAKVDLEAAKVDQELQREVQLEKQAELELKVEEAQVLIKEIEDTLESYQSQYDSIDEQDAKLQGEIDDLIEQLRKQEAAAGTTKQVNSTGSYIWPSAASNVVTSYFGVRQHPVYGDYRNHYGIDIGAPYGTNILAADGGTVVTATYSSSYGYYVIINHGGGNTTLYAHMSKILVSVGQSVTQGQTIGLVGSTGVSTGPHLHFEIRVNGTRVNPLNYYSNYTVSANCW